MKALELTAEVDEQHSLHLTLPQDTARGPVRVIVLLPEATEDETGAAWASGVAREWSAELADEREDIYSLEDGEPLHAAR